MLVVRQPSGSALSLGEEVAVGWDEEDLYLFPDEGGEALTAEAGEALIAEEKEAFSAGNGEA